MFINKFYNFYNIIYVIKRTGVKHNKLRISSILICTNLRIFPIKKITTKIKNGIPTYQLDPKFSHKSYYT